MEAATCTHVTGTDVLASTRGRHPTSIKVAPQTLTRLSLSISQGRRIFCARPPEGSDHTALQQKGAPAMFTINSAAQTSNNGISGNNGISAGSGGRSVTAYARPLSRRAFIQGMLAASAVAAAATGLGSQLALASSATADSSVAYNKDGSAVKTDGSSAADDKSASSIQIDKGQLDHIRVALVQLIDNNAFETMIEGFKDGMKQAGYVEGENATFDLKNAQGDTGTLNSIAAALKNSTDYDVVVPIATPAAQAIVNAGVTQPIVFISVTDPLAAGITTSLEKPDMGATGTSNIIPVDEIFLLADTLLDTQVGKSGGKIGILYSTGESNAVATAERTREFLDKDGRSYAEATVANSSEVAQAASQLASTCELIFVPVDSTVQAAMPQAVEAATDAGIPVFGSDPVMVQSGALACVSVSNYDQGVASASLAVKATNGAAVADLPVITYDSFTPVLNKKTAADLGITLPTDSGYTIIEG